MKMRKVLTIGIPLLLLGGAAWYFMRKRKGQTSIQETINETDSSSPVTKSATTNVGGDKVNKFLKETSRNRVIALVPNKGKYKKGDKVKITSSLYGNITTMVWYVYTRDKRYDIVYLDIPYKGDSKGGSISIAT